MQIRISPYGTNYKFNDQGQMHSLNGKPAYITSKGVMHWYNNGTPVKARAADGRVTSLETEVNGISIVEFDALWPRN